MYRLLFVVWATFSVYGNAEDLRRPLPFPLSPLETFTLNYESVKNSECKRHSLTFLEDLKNLKLWAVQMNDASGKISSGVLRGNVNWLGDDKECYGVSSKPGAGEDDKDNIRGQYCAVRFFAEFTNHKTNSTNDLEEIFDLIHTHKALQNSIEDRIVFFPSFSPLTLGLCIPRSCTPNDLEAALLEWISPHNASEVEVKLLVRPDSCTKEENNKWHLKSYITLNFFVVMTLIGIVGAIYESKKEKRIRGGETVNNGKLMRIFLTFSFRSNMRLLLNTDTPIDEMGCLHGIRAFFSIFLYMLHRTIVGLHGSLSNRSDVAFFMDGAKSMVLRSFWNHVDTFVVLSGLLTSYYTVKKLQEGGKLSILKMYIQRYLKFTPLFFVCVLFIGNILEYIVTEAQYTRLVQVYISNCQEAWWNTLTYTNTFRGFDNMCYQPAHQLETDMQMYLLSPFFILILWKMRVYGILIMSILLSLFSAFKYYVVITENLATVLYYGISIHQLVRSANYLYLNFLQRLVPYMSGILLGYCLRVRNKDFKFSKMGLLIGDVLALWSVYYSFFSLRHTAHIGYIYDVNEAAVFGTLQPLFWSYAICWFIFICVTGQAEWINRKLKWKWFQVTSRLSYAFYMTQMIVMVTEIGRNPNPIVFSPAMIFDLNILFTSLLVATWLTLLFLSPVGALWKVLFEQSKAETKEVKGE